MISEVDCGTPYIPIRNNYVGVIQTSKAISFLVEK